MHRTKYIGLQRKYTEIVFKTYFFKFTDPSLRTPAVGKYSVINLILLNLGHKWKNKIELKPQVLDVPERKYSLAKEFRTLLSLCHPHFTHYHLHHYHLNSDDFCIRLLFLNY